MALGTILGIAGAIGGLISGAKKAWYAIKQPKPKVQVSQQTGEVVGSQYAVPSYSGTTGGLPALPGIVPTSATVPAVYGTGTAAVPQTSGIQSALPWWKGPGGKLQLPWNDPRVPEFLKSVSLDDAYLRIYYRAPKGYVVVRDPSGKPYCMLKSVARSLGFWKATAKPPISATDWKHYKRNKAIEKKLKKICPRPKPRTVVYKSSRSRKAA